MYWVIGILIYLAIGAACAAWCWRAPADAPPEDDIEFHPAYVIAQVLFWLPFAIGIAIEAARGLKENLPRPSSRPQVRLP